MIPRSLHARLRRLLGLARQFRRLALKACETYLPPALGYALSRLVDPFFRLSALAADYAERLPIDEGLVMYESYNGRDFAGNPYALFLHLLGREDYAGLRHVVVLPSLRHPKARPFRRHPRVRFVRVDSAAYLRCAETCRWFVNDASYKPYLVKRPGQEYLYTWHSTLLKKLAGDKGAPWEARNVTRALVAADWFISPNRFTTELLLSSHGAAPFVDGTIAEFGYPRNDLTVDADKAAVRRRLGLPEGDRLVVFAPTWRGEQNAVDNVAEVLEQRRLLAEALGPGWRVAVKFHTMVYRFLGRRERRLCVPLDLDANELLAATDVLVTDYSGIFFDYLLTGNPVVFFAPDREEYARAKQGFYLDLEGLPGPVCADIGETAAAVLRADELRAEYAERYAAYRSRFVGEDDGGACRRTVDLCLGKKPDPRAYRLPRGKKRILLYPGPLNPNGVTTSFLALAGALDYSRYEVAVLLPDEEPNRVYQAMIDRRACLLYRTAPDAFTRAEYAAHARFVQRGSRSPADLPAAAYRRSLDRLVAGKSFDAVVNFHGYQPGDAAALALGLRSPRRVVFLHNDLERDRRIKQPQLRSVFSAYKYYDELFCVSEDSLKANLEGMAAYVRSEFGDELAPRMSYAFNIVDPERMRRLAREALPAGLPPPDAAEASFLTIGRLSPEKNQARLLDAFARFRSRRPGSRLYLVGDGRESGALRAKARALGLGSSAVFVPFLANPYPLIAACDCFVLPSDLEGQPVTILEALTLGKPVIATDIPGPRDLLKGGEGRLVAPSAEALAAAMEEFVAAGKAMERRSFDAEAYAAAAARDFEAKVLRA